jgi:hypothetical protein
MTDAVIVSTARTPIGKAYRGALNSTEGATLLGHAIGQAVARAKVDPAEVEDVVMGAALQQGSTGGNIARKALLRAGLPVTVGGTTIDRQCASGLQAIALAARSVIFDGVEIAVGGGGESVSLVQNDKMNAFHAQDPALLKIKGEVYMPMIDTAEVVARRYGISRERQDEYSLESQRRVAAAQQGGKFNDELAPITTMMGVADKATGEISFKEVTGARRRLYDHGRQCQPAVGRRQRVGDHERQGGCQARPEAARHLPRLRRRRLRAGRDGHWPGVRGAAAAQAPWSESRRYRSLGVERGFRGAGALLPRQARH